MNWQLVNLAITWFNCGIAIGFFAMTLDFDNDGQTPTGLSPA